MRRRKQHNLSKEIILKTPVIFHFLANKRWTFKDLAERIDVTPVYVGLLLSHKRHPSLPVVGKLAETLESEPWQIAEGIEEPTIRDTNGLTEDEKSLLQFFAQNDELSRMILKIVHHRVPSIWS